MVLFVLALAGTVLAAAARRSCERALLAHSAQEELQLKWSALSARALCLPAAERLLDVAAAKDADADAPPPATVSFTMTLGGLSCDLIVGDEQAKANVNLLAARFGDAVMSDRLQNLQAGQREVLTVELRPGGSPAGVIAAVPRRYGSLAQIFGSKPPTALLPSGSDEHGPVERITCWGSGQVNLRRADAVVVRQTLADLVNESEFDKLEKFRRIVPGCSVAEALKTMEIPESRAKNLRLLLTDTSHCHSLWLVAHGRTRDWFRLEVAQEGDAENDAEEWTFLW
jgi:hypothetical protein